MSTAKRARSGRSQQRLDLEDGEQRDKCPDQQSRASRRRGPSARSYSGRHPRSISLGGDCTYRLTRATIARWCMTHDDGLTPDAPLDCRDVHRPPRPEPRDRAAGVQRGRTDRAGARRALRLSPPTRRAVPGTARPGRRRLPDRIEVLVVDDGSTDETDDDRRGAARGERPRIGRHDPARSCASPHGGKGAAVRAGMLDADRGPDRLRRRGHGDAARPAAAARRGARRPRRRRSGRGSSRTARTCARPSPATGGCWARSSTRSRRSGWSGRCRTRNAGSRGSPAPRRTTCSPASRSRASSSTSS